MSSNMLLGVGTAGAVGILVISAPLIYGGTCGLTYLVTKLFFSSINPFAATIFNAIAFSPILTCTPINIGFTGIIGYVVVHHLIDINFVALSALKVFAVGFTSSIGLTLGTLMVVAGLASLAVFSGIRRLA